VVGIAADVTMVPPGTLERSTGKARRVLDLR
jgi:phenylacetate-coenzyme A ligase PaaK-like adenylate-forming protein